MPTLSGSVDFNQTRNGIVTDALVLLGAFEEGETPNAEALQYGIRQLERMVKHWQGQGTHLWSRREATLFITPSQAAYELGPSSAAHAAEENDIARTTLSADEASGQTVIGIGSTTDGLVTMAASDKVAIVLDDDTFHWTTIATVDSTTQITLSVATTGAASSGNFVYAYTNDLDRPLRIIDVRRRDESNDQDTPIIVQSHEEYQRLPNKLIDGETNIVYYHPEHRNARGTVHLWPRPSTVARTMRMSCMLPLQDFDASGNNADLPTEWLDTIVWNLAKRLIPSYGASGKASAKDIKAGGTTMLNEMVQWDQEPESVYFAPNTEHNWGD
jgi:hypothetical protein